MQYTPASQLGAAGSMKWRIHYVRPCHVTPPLPSPGSCWGW